MGPGDPGDRGAHPLGLRPGRDRLSWLGRISSLLGDYPAARELLERARLLAVEQGYKPGEIFAELAWSAETGGNPNVAPEELALIATLRNQPA